MNKNIEWLLCSFAGAMTIAQTNQIFQMIELALTCLATLVALAFTVWKWWKKATSDGEITPDEIKDLVDDVDKYKDNFKDNE